MTFCDNKKEGEPVFLRGVAMAMLAFFLLLVQGCSSSGDTSPEVLQELKEIGRLDLAEVTSEETFVLSGSGHTLASVRNLDDIVKLLDGLLRGGERVGVYSFKRYAVASIDLEKITPDMIEVDHSKGSIRLTLPPIEVIQPGRDVTLKTLHERFSGSQRQFSPDERQKMKNEVSKRSAEMFMLGKPSYNQLVERAERKAKSYFTSLFHMRGYTDILIEVQHPN